MRCETANLIACSAALPWMSNGPSSATTPSLIRPFTCSGTARPTGDETGAAARPRRPRTSTIHSPGAGFFTTVSLRGASRPGIVGELAYAHGGTADGSLVPAVVHPGG